MEFDVVAVIPTRDACHLVWLEAKSGSLSRVDSACLIRSQEVLRRAIQLGRPGQPVELHGIFLVPSLPARKERNTLEELRNSLEPSGITTLLLKDLRDHVMGLVQG